MDSKAMFDDLGSQTIQEINARWDKIEIANVFDALENLGYPNQCLDIGIRPLDVDQIVSGPAVTVRGTKAPFRAEELADNIDFRHRKLNAHAYDGCVVVMDNAGEPYSAKLGEFEAWGLHIHGARGFVTDGPVRDSKELLNIKGFSVFSKGSTPIPSNMRWYYNDFNKTIGITGTLTSQVRIDPGDWIVGGRDGVIAIPRGIMMRALEEAEKLERDESRMRTALLDGKPLEEAYNVWGRE